MARLPGSPFQTQIANKKGQRVDLFAIDEQKGALLVEAKRIWSLRHANLVYNDMKKLEGGPLEGRFNRFGLGKLWFAVMVFTHRIEVSNWWQSDDKAIKIPKAAGRRRYVDHKGDWLNLGKALQMYEGLDSTAIKVPNMSKRRTNLYLLTAIRPMKVEKDAVLEWQNELPHKCFAQRRPARISISGID